MSFPHQAIFWDIDGTLADSEPVHERSFHQAIKGLGLSLPDDLHDRILGLSEEVCHAFLVDHCGLRMDLADWTHRRHAIYMGMLGEVAPFPRALQIWAGLEAAGIAQMPVSNSDRRLVMANLDVLGLSRPRMKLVSRNDVRAGKPAPEPYLRAAWLLELDPTTCAVVEDSPTGVQAGRAAGMTVYAAPDMAPALREKLDLPCALSLLDGLPAQAAPVA
ncbi:HAD family phosphatase [Thioclava sp. GXIMD4216]|uniref:HAD family phosphatase n=1 Tax=Thioclava litoralis TaxID=3076557 RepID=A0ABZ1DVM3_9RHOB|nr:HAD family phosphatase [Thioclava sp. FTW29]